MTKTKKMMLGIGTLATAFAPVASVIACGSSSTTDNSKILTFFVLQDNELPTWQKIINKFKTANADFIKKNGINDIKIIRGSASLQNLKNKGVRDEEAFSDFFLFAGNELSKYLENDALKPFSSTTSTDFATKYMNSDRFLQKVKSGVSNGKLYGIPQNIESMVALGIKGTETEANKEQITEFSDLWTSAGFFNTAKQTTSATQVNLRDIVKTNDEGKVVWGSIGSPSTEVAKKAEWQKVLKNGFVKILDQIIKIKAKTGQSLNQTMFASKWDESQPKVHEFIVNNKEKVKYLRGGWAIDKITELAKKQAKKDNVSEAAIAKIKVVASTPTSWKPWAGGWLYAMNARITQNEQNVAEKLISYFLSKDWAKDFYEKMGKISPTTEGKTVFENDAVYGAAGSVVKAIYGSFANSLPKPIDNAFNDVWGKYSKIIEKYKQQLSSLTASSKAALADKLVNDFVVELEALME